MGSEDLREMGDAWGEEGVGGRGSRRASGLCGASAQAGSRTRVGQCVKDNFSQMIFGTCPPLSVRRASGSDRGRSTHQPLSSSMASEHGQLMAS